MRYVDLSSSIHNDHALMPELMRTEIAYSDHRAGAAAVKAVFDVDAEYLRDGEGWAIEAFTRFGTHNSTHVDAPWHYNSTIEGKPAKTIDQLPLDWFQNPGVCLDFTDREDGDAIEAAAVAAALEKSEHELKPLDIVLIRTDRDVYVNEPDYFRRGPGVTADATRWLHERGVRVMGIDAWGWDRPLHMQAEDVARERRAGIFWEAHQLDLEYSQIERLVNLRELPPTGFVVSCFPLRISAGSGAPARVVAMIPDEDVA